MATPKPIKKSSRPQKPSSPQKKAGTQTQLNPVPDTGDKPYGLVPMPAKGIDRRRPVGQEQFQAKLLSGKLHLTLSAQTTSFVASGVVAMGRDVQMPRVDLVKTAVHQENKLIIPGSSLKGVVRSAYEALTRSCLCKTKVRREAIPEGYSECKINTKREKFDVCPACRVFGAMGWQGLVAFPDAIGQATDINVEFMQSLYKPEPKNPMYDNNGKVSGRKFYYHAAQAVSSKKTPDGQDKKGLDAQKAKRGHVFKTVLQFKNLTEAELGTLFVILGQDEKHPMALKVGGGKPIGMGSLSVKVESLEKPATPKDRYTRYILPDSDRLTGESLQAFMQTAIAQAHNTLIEAQQMQELAKILAWPTQNFAPEGMY